MIVLKFGGTSVQAAGQIDKVVGIAQSQIQRAPILVASAMAGVTDELYEIADIASEGRIEEAHRRIEATKARHREAIDALLEGGIRQKSVEEIERLFGELSSLVKGLSLLRECSPRTFAAVVAFGERLSTKVIASCAEQRGIATTWVDARAFIITEEQFESASPDFDATNRAIREKLSPEAGKLIVTQGFIGSTPSGATTTLGRGGSDYSATIIGAALNAEEVQIWTDVNGIMTSDPRIVQNARTIGKISYDEAAELAFFGARVVHPSTIQPAIEGGIPVLVKNTNDPDGRYTAIIARTHETGVRAITGKKKTTLINITSSRMVNAYGFLKRIFSIFESHRTSVDLIATSEVSVSVTIDNASSLDKIVRDLKQIGNVTVDKDNAIISLIGHDLWKDPVFIADVFTAIRTTPVKMITLGSSDVNLSIVVPESYLDDTVRTLHETFFATSM